MLVVGYMMMGMNKVEKLNKERMVMTLTDPYGNKLLKVGTNIIYEGKPGKVIGYDGINDGYAVSYKILLDNTILYVYYDEVKEDK